MIKPKLILGETVVRVTWEDAWSDNGHYDLKAILEEPPYITESVGVIIRNDKKGIAVTRESIGHNKFRNVQFIPRAMVRKVEALK